MNPSSDRPLFHLFLHIGRLLEEQLRAHLDPLGLHQGRARLLMALASARSPQCINDLSAQLHVSQPTTTDLVKGLELQSLVQRIPSGHDRRQTLVRLTTAGEVAAPKVAAAWDEVEINLRVGIADYPLAPLRSLLESTRDHLLHRVAVGIALLCSLPCLAQPVQIPGTGQDACYDTSAAIPCPEQGQMFYGQDFQQHHLEPSYSSDSARLTVTDNITGLVWTRQLFGPFTWREAIAEAEKLSLAGLDDWRLPSITELYSILDFRGYFGPSPSESRPFINQDFFEFQYGSGDGNSPGSRWIDVQLWSSTRYIGTTMGGDATVFGVNFADARIKGYPEFEPRSTPPSPARMFVRFVRGREWPRSSFKLDSKAVVQDESTGLLWQRTDDGQTRSWADALAYCNSLELDGKTGWRLPTAKELQLLVDYRRAPSITGTAALPPPLRATNPEQYYWTSTTVLDGPPHNPASKAVIIAFGRALGWMEAPPGSGQRRLFDVHGAGSQRADFKQGDPSRFPFGFGPQGDDVRIFNSVRCVISPTKKD